jgi:hypothetical protein
MSVHHVIVANSLLPKGCIALSTCIQAILAVGELMLHQPLTNPEPRPAVGALMAQWSMTTSPVASKTLLCLERCATTIDFTLEVSTLNVNCRVIPKIMTTLEPRFAAFNITPKAPIFAVNILHMGIHLGLVIVCVPAAHMRTCEHLGPRGMNRTPKMHLQCQPIRCHMITARH